MPVLEYSYNPKEEHDTNGVLFERFEYLNKRTGDTVVHWREAKGFFLEQDEVWVRERNADGSIVRHVLVDDWEGFMKLKPGILTENLARDFDKVKEAMTKFIADRA